MPPPSRGAKPRQIIGWREHIALPDLAIDRIKAKVDTGARTTALHAEGIEEFRRDGRVWVRFLTPPYHGSDCEPVSARVIDRREIRNTSGIPQERPIIHTTLVIGHRHWGIDISLTDRTEMGFDLILGRTALRRHRLLVDPGRSFLAEEPVPPAGSRLTTTLPSDHRADDFPGKEDS
ncbi:MAG: ATP-dependent zinc protease [Pseudomonadota bacterium]